MTLCQRLRKCAFRGTADDRHYLAGPPAMLTAMRHMLTSAAVDEDDTRTEEFPGY